MTHMLKGCDMANCDERYGEDFAAKCVAHDKILLIDVKLCV